MKISHLDHLVLTVADIATRCQFYQSALNFEVITFAENRKALLFGSQKINLHEAGKEFETLTRKDVVNGKWSVFFWWSIWDNQNDKH